MKRFFCVLTFLAFWIWLGGCAQTPKKPIDDHTVSTIYIVFRTSQDPPESPGTDILKRSPLTYEVTDRFITELRSRSSVTIRIGPSAQDTSAAMAAARRLGAVLLLEGDARVTLRSGAATCDVRLSIYEVESGKVIYNSTNLFSGPDSQEVIQKAVSASAKSVPVEK